MRDIIIALGFLAVFAVLWVLTSVVESHDQRLVAIEQANERVPQFTQVLVGQGCEGPRDIAVAVEEDLLPKCQRIDVHEVALGE